MILNLFSLLFQMFELLGFERFELIQTLLKHRSEIKNPPVDKDRKIAELISKCVTDVNQDFFSVLCAFYFVSSDAIFLVKNRHTGTT